MDKWAELRTAFHVAKLGTVSAAAEALGFHRATVNRHIDLLEAAIGSRIFIRHARGYALTETGKDVLRVAQQTDAMIDELAGRLRSGRALIDGEIRLTLLSPFVALVMSAVAAFHRANPQCRVEIDATDDLARLEHGEAHVAVRAGARPDHPDYVVSGFGRVGFTLYAHDSYVRARGLPKKGGDLTGHTFVVPPGERSRLPFGPWIADHIRPEMIAVSSRDFWVNRQAIFQGLGMGFLGDHDVAGRGDLHPVLAPRKEWSAALWLVTHVDLHRTEKVQAMLTCLKAARPTVRDA